MARRSTGLILMSRLIREVVLTPLDRKSRNGQEDAPIFLRLDAAPLCRQQRLDDAPLEVREIVAHDPGPDLWERESLLESRVQQKIEYRA